MNASRGPADDRQNPPAGRQESQSLPADSPPMSAQSIAHDLNNLLMVIENSAADLLTQLHQEVRPKAELLLKTTRAAVALALQLQTGVQSPPRQLHFCDLNQMLADLLPAMRALAGAAVEVKLLPVPGQLPVNVDIDALQQVLLNLVANAREAMPGGGIVIVSTQAETNPAAESGLPPGHYAMVTVRDTGAGMSDEVRQRAFEPHFTTKQSAGNSGLGLANARELVSRQSGALRLSETSSHGTSFQLFLPLMRLPVALPDTEKLILLVEDADQLRRMLEVFLVSQGYRVIARSGGDEMLQVGSSPALQPKVIVIDVLLSGTPAPDVVSRLQQIHPGLQVIFISGRARASEGMPDLPADAQFLQKPFSLSVLAGSIDRMLAGNPTPDSPAETI